MARMWDILHIPTGIIFSEYCINGDRTRYTEYPFKSKVDCNKAFYIVELLVNNQYTTTDHMSVNTFMRINFNIHDPVYAYCQWIEFIYTWWCVFDDLHITANPMSGSSHDFSSFVDLVKSTYNRDEYEIITYYTDTKIQYASTSRNDDISIGFINN